MNKVEKIIECVNTMSEVLEIERIECAKDLFKRKMYLNSDKIVDISEAVITIMIEDDVKPSVLNDKMLGSLIRANTDIFRKYYKQLDEKNKVQLISNMDGVVLLFIDKRDINQDNAYFAVDYSKTGSPLNLASSLCKKRYYGNSRETVDKYNKFIFNLIDKEASFFFKYIDIQKIIDNRYHSFMDSFLQEDPSNDYGIKCLLRRISMYQERRITKNNIEKFVKYINNTNNCSPQVCKLFMDTLNKYVPEKIMVDIMI